MKILRHIHWVTHHLLDFEYHHLHLQENKNKY